MTEWRIALDGTRIPSREEVGGKARAVAMMRRHNMPVPPAFVLPTAIGGLVTAAGGQLPEEAWSAAAEGIRELEEATGRTFGGSESPLLVSVRSGAAVSMPGMMDTVLNLGINDDTEAALGREASDPDFARDTHRRFVESYTRIVAKAVGEEGGRVPDDPYEQLRAAILAVFASWGSARAKAYRRHWAIPEEGGTAVTVQAMVYGNLDDESGTGVFFTRDPSSGAPKPYGEFLPRGQGEDVVSGEAEPLDLTALHDRLPDVHDALLEAGRVLERENGDVQDVEFTVERGQLYLLQTRAAKRSPAAAVRLAVDFAREGLIDPAEALRRVRAEHVEALLRPAIDPPARESATVLAKGEPACPGIASGLAVGDPDEAALLADDDTPVVLVRPSTSPDDVHGMIAAAGVCTEVGGRTSHAAVVSRELGRPAVVGCGRGSLMPHAGETITIDGASGEVFAGELKTVEPDVRDDPQLAQLAAWAAEHPDVLDPDHPLHPDQRS